MGDHAKTVVWLHGRVKTPPFSEEARNEIGALIRHVQRGRSLSLPESRPMPEIGPRCHELRVTEKDHEWRIIYRIDPEHVVVAEVFAKTSQHTPEHIKAACRRRLRRYDKEQEG